MTSCLGRLGFNGCVSSLTRMHHAGGLGFHFYFILFFESVGANCLGGSFSQRLRQCQGCVPTAEDAPYINLLLWRVLRAWLVLTPRVLLVECHVEMPTTFIFITFPKQLARNVGTVLHVRF